MVTPRLNSVLVRTTSTCSDFCVLSANTKVIDLAFTLLPQQINELEYSLRVRSQRSPWHTSELKRLTLGYLFSCSSSKAQAQWTILITPDNAPCQGCPWPCEPFLPEKAETTQAQNHWPPTPCHSSGLTAGNISDPVPSLKLLFSS